MIPEIEIKEKARISKVPISTIERDYAQSHLLANLPKMAFKGGTCIRKIYIDSYRFSDDLDFTLLEEINFSEFKKNILKAIEKTRNSSGISFLDDFRSEEVENGYVLTTYFRILRLSGDPHKIKIDITKKENEMIVNSLQEKDIIHEYSDKINQKICVYSIQEIFAEKVRSLFERTRPRDLYDVWYLNKQIKFDGQLFEKKCKYKQIEPSLKDLYSRKENFKNAWEKSLGNQLPELPSANMVFDNVIEFLKKSI